MDFRSGQSDRSPQGPASREAREQRRFSTGAEPIQDQVSFRVWAPAHERVELVLHDPKEDPRRILVLEREPDGHHSIVCPARPGDRYGFRLGGDERILPDPTSRFQPNGPHGLSEIIDPRRFVWSDAAWPGPVRDGQVIYELHVGTFTEEGRYDAARAHLRPLADLGVTCIELMPLAEFAGNVGWGYDGVDLYAPSHLYGRPDDLRRFVDTAHDLGIAVILDVVYNHLGPDGDYLKEYAPQYFSDRYSNEWGEPFNFDGPDSHGVRSYIAENARYWIEEFHMDGYRFDATQQIFDESTDFILSRIIREARGAAGHKRTLLVVENEPQDPACVRPPAHGGVGADACWNDDFHHTARVALLGRREGYLSDYTGSPQSLLSAIKHGYLYQGQWYGWQGKPRGRPSADLAPDRFIHYIENHDQVANSIDGKRLHQLTSPGLYRSMTALLLLSPQVPMLFQGQEYGTTRPFHYFADHKPEIAKSVREGRREFLSQFPSLRASRSHLVDPGDPDVARRCRLEPKEQRIQGPIYRLHRDLLRLRKTDITLRRQYRARRDGAILSDEAFLIRWFTDANEDRLLVLNLGPDLRLSPLPEPLTAPPEGHLWETLWSSEDVSYGGRGSPAASFIDDWSFAAESATLLGARSDS